MHGDRVSGDVRSADPAAHAAFWAEAVHYVAAPPPAGFDSGTPRSTAGPCRPSTVTTARRSSTRRRGPRLFFQKVPEPKTAKNRCTSTSAAAGAGTALEGECTRLVALGARRVRRLEADGINAVCIVMQDPEGNEFCLD